MRGLLRTALSGAALAALAAPALAGGRYGAPAPSIAPFPAPGHAPAPAFEAPPPFAPAASFAPECGPTAFDCEPGVWVSATDTFRDDVLVGIEQPMGHLRSVDYRRSPHVSITRIHDAGPVPGLEDHPAGFTDGCFPETTGYCGGGHDAAPLSAPRVARPLAPVAHAPVMQEPVMQGPVMHHGPQPLRQWTASYNADPSRYQPRQYGSLDFVPGIAHVPTSWVDRDPARAQAALGGRGTAPGPQTGLQRIPDGTPGPQIPVSQFMAPHPVQPGSVVQPGPASHAPEVAVDVLRIQPGAPSPTPLMPTYPHGVPGNYGAAPAMQQAPVMQGAVMQAPLAQAPVAPMAGPGLLAPAYPVQPGLPVPVGNGTFGSQVAADGSYWEQVHSGPKMMGSTVVTDIVCKRQLEQEVVNPVVGVPVPGCAPAAHAMHPGTHGLAGGRF